VTRPMLEGESKSVDFDEIINQIGPYAILSGTKDIKPMGASQLIAAAKEAEHRDGEGSGKVWICAVGYQPILGPDGKPYGSMGLYWVPAKEILTYWRRGRELLMLKALRGHYASKGNAYVLKYETAMKLRDELKVAVTGINI
jgi:hypothetical protein